MRTKDRRIAKAARKLVAAVAKQERRSADRLLYGAPLNRPTLAALLDVIAATPGRG